MNARYSHVKVAIECGPITRRGSRSPTFTSSKCGETPRRFDSSHSRRTLAICLSSSRDQRRTSPIWLAKKPRFSASAAR